MGFFDRGSFVAEAGYDLRVTARCVRDDLGRDPSETLEAIARIPIIRAFCNKHARTREFADTVGPAAGTKTLGVLRYGDDHRGAVWNDRVDDVMWLCGYGRHRSGASDDAFPYFDTLKAAGTIYPDYRDRELLYVDRAARLIDALPTESARLSAVAAASPGIEVQGRLGSLAIRLVVVEVEGIRELHVAVSMRGADHGLLLTVLAALRPDSDELGDWRTERELPTGPLDGTRQEIAYSCLLP